MVVSNYDSVLEKLEKLDKIARRPILDEGSLYGRSTRAITSEELKALQEQAEKEWGLGDGAIHRAQKRRIAAEGMLWVALALAGIVVAIKVKNWGIAAGFGMIAVGCICAVLTNCQYRRSIEEGKRELDQLAVVTAWALRQEREGVQAPTATLRDWFSQYNASFIQSTREERLVLGQVAVQIPPPVQSVIQNRPIG